MPTNYPILNLANAGVAVSKDYVDNGYDGTYASPEPKSQDWRERHFVLKDPSGNSLGIFKGPVDDNITTQFTLYQPNEPECATLQLKATLLDPMDFSTQVAFETLPILEVWQYVTNGVLLKYPD